MTDVHRTIIVPAALVETYRTLAAVWASGAGMFTTPVTAGSGITGYISAGEIGEDVAALLDNPAAFTEQINALTGASYTVAQVQSLRDAMIHCSDRDPHEVLAELGLTIWSETE